ncbi:MAG: heme biosynthesis HemY N-terminal domain-containing protein [Pseudomonadota bacterium]
MKTLFWLLTLAALAIGAALLGRLTDGYVLWVMPPWRAEISFNLFVVLQVVALVVVYLLLRLIVNTLRLPGVVNAFRARRARVRKERAAAEALRLFWEGRYSQVLKSAELVASEKVGADGTASVTSEAPGIATLAALKAAHALRDPARIATWQARAEALDAAGWRTARLMAEIRIALDARDFATAEAALEQLGTKERRQISAQRFALRLAQGKGDWAGMLRLARQLEKHKVLLPEQAQPLRLHAYHGMLDALPDDPAQLVRFWRDMPASDRLDTRLAQRAAWTLANAGHCAECAQLIEDYLDERWESVLLEPYADCQGGDVLGRIAHCEKWLHEHPQDALLLLALGRLCMQQQLWGKAQSFLEASLAVAPSCAAHIELARLFDRLERADAANRHYRAAAQCQNTKPQFQSRGIRKSV